VKRQLTNNQLQLFIIAFEIEFHVNFAFGIKQNFFAYHFYKFLYLRTEIIAVTIYIIHHI